MLGQELIKKEFLEEKRKCSIRTLGGCGGGGVTGEGRGGAVETVYKHHKGDQVFIYSCIAR